MVASTQWSYSWLDEPVIRLTAPEVEVVVAFVQPSIVAQAFQLVINGFESDSGNREIAS